MFWSSYVLEGCKADFLLRGCWLDKDICWSTLMALKRELGRVKGSYLRKPLRKPVHRAQTIKQVGTHKITWTLANTHTSMHKWIALCAPYVVPLWGRVTAVMKSFCTILKTCLFDSKHKSKLATTEMRFLPDDLLPFTEGGIVSLPQTLNDRFR